MSESYVLLSEVIFRFVLISFKVCKSKIQQNRRVFVKFQRFNFGFTFLPRCMECRRGLAMRFRSVCLSVCQTRAL